jgi:hypothetical protein
MKSPQRRGRRLPEHLRPYFWEYRFAQLSWATDANLIIARVLAVGHWQSIRWLLRRLGKPALKDWLIARRGAGLSDRQLRYWEVILELPRRTVNAWLRNPARQVWEKRACP